MEFFHYLFWKCFFIIFIDLHKPYVCKTCGIVEMWLLVGRSFADKHIFFTSSLIRCRVSMASKVCLKMRMLLGKIYKSSCELLNFFSSHLLGRRDVSWWDGAYQFGIEYTAGKFSGTSSIMRSGVVRSPFSCMVGRNLCGGTNPKVHRAWRT